jgi:hypothetical protein
MSGCLTALLYFPLFGLQLIAIFFNFVYLCTKLFAMTFDTKKIWFIVGLIFIGAMSRLLPHLPNFTPIAAIGLFGAATIRPLKLAFVIPFIALWVSDFIIMNWVLSSYYEGFRFFGHLWVYLAFLIIFLLGTSIKKIKFWNILGLTLSSSLIFFLISNLGHWMSSVAYPPTFGGLIACYVAAIPFLGNTVAGDLIYSALFFGSYFVYTRYYLKTAMEPVR